MMIRSIIVVLICASFGRSENYKTFEGIISKDKVGPTAYRTVKNVHKLTECVHYCKFETACQYVNFNEISFECGFIDDGNYARNDLPISTILTTEIANNVFVEFEEIRQEDLPRDCEDVGITTQGIYRIRPTGATESFYVQCDNGWTLIQKRYDGSIDFNRLWQDYKIGFGNLKGEFWLGLENMHLLTNQASYTITFEFDLYIGTHIVQDTYSGFSVGEEANWYQMFVSGGPDPNQFAQLNGMYFTTRDQDHDQASSNCASVDKKGAGWWYLACAYLNMNAPMPTSATECVGGTVMNRCMKMFINNEHTGVVNSVVKIKRE